MPHDASLDSDSQTVTHTDIPMALPNPATERMKVGKVQWNEELKSIVATCESEPEVISLFLELMTVRSVAMAAVWIERNQREFQFRDSRFATHSLNSQSVRNTLLNAVVQAGEQGSNGHVRPDSIRGSVITCQPICLNRDREAFLLVLARDSHSALQEMNLLTQLVAAHFDLWRGRDQLAQLDFETKSSAAIIELVAEVENSKTSEQACYTIANRLQSFLGCLEVAVGLVPKTGNAVRLMAVSGQSNVDPQSKKAQLLAAAMDDTVLQGRPARFPGGSSNLLSQSHSLRRLSENNPSTHISVPLVDHEQETVGVIICSGTLQFGDSTAINLVEAIDVPLGSSLQVVRRLEGNGLSRLLRRVGGRMKVSTRVLLAMIASIIIGSMFVPVPYQIRCQCTAAPVVRRMSVAPYDGLLENTFVRPGDIVEEGSPIARMDGREIRVQLNSLQADLQRARKESDSHRAKHEVAEMLMAEYEQKKLIQEVRLLKTRQQLLEIKSPLKGMVIGGSIERRQNYPVKRGQELYEIAPLSPMQIEIDIPTDEVLHVTEGDSVRVRFEGFGLKTLSGTITQIRPRSEIRHQKNVFVAEVTMQNEGQLIRPGMQGTARILTEKRMLGWCLFHQPWERTVTALGF